MVAYSGNMVHERGGALPPPLLCGLALCGVKGLDDVGVFGRDRLALELHGGGEFVAAWFPVHRQDLELLDLLNPG
jgi:hypothetical protein